MKNLTKSLILIVGLIFAMMMLACELQNDIEIGQITNYDFEGSEEIPEFETIVDAIRWVSRNMVYVSDEGDYWQTPEETFYRRNDENKMMGDCEDKVILLQYIIDIQFHIPSYMIIVQLPNEKGAHAMTYVDNFYYEIPEGEGNLIVSLPRLRDNIKIIYTIPYSKVMWMTVNYHDGVGEYE